MHAITEPRLRLVQFLAFRLQEVSAERDGLSTDLRKTKVLACRFPCCQLLFDGLTAAVPCSAAVRSRRAHPNNTAGRLRNA